MAMSLTTVRAPNFFVTPWTTKAKSVALMANCFYGRFAHAVYQTPASTTGRLQLYTHLSNQHSTVLQIHLESKLLSSHAKLFHEQHNSTLYKRRLNKLLAFLHQNRKASFVEKELVVAANIRNLFSRKKILPSWLSKYFSAPELHSQNSKPKRQMLKN